MKVCNKIEKVKKVGMFVANKGRERNKTVNELRD